ncbi:MAG: hypothetical protein HZB92_02865 [Euryarchaeota archaeon]|nr:hypothetical protein [Euryarchaeota archaeon]
MGNVGGSSRTCSRCGRPSEQDGICGKCAAELPSPKSPSERAAEAIEHARNEMLRGKERGVMLEDAEDLLTGAKLMLDAHSYEDAIRIATECGGIAEERILQYEMLLNSISRSQVKIRDADEHGGDTKEARSMLQKAQDALKGADYKRGITYAIRSADIADKERKKYDSWKVEVGAYLKTK